jgi:two-component system response regulator DesR
MLPDMDGVEVARRIHEITPDTAIVVWTGHPDLWPPEALESLGVKGYLPKTVSVAGIVRTLREVAQGHTVAVTVDPSGAHLAGRPLVTEREIAILRLLPAGERPAEIGDHLGLSARTVERDLANLRAKFDARSAADLVLKAQRRGLLPPAI